MALLYPPTYIAQTDTGPAEDEEQGVDNGLYSKVCFASFGSALYNYSGPACSRQYPKAIEWDSFPLKVFIDKKDRKHIQSGIVRGIARMEALTERDLFVIVEEQTPDVDIYMSYTYSTYPQLAALLQNWIGYASHHYDRNNKLASDIVFIQNFEDDPKKFEDVVVHELGHALGLEHDGIEDSIMFPTALDKPQKFTQKDIDIMKGL